MCRSRSGQSLALSPPVKNDSQHKSRDGSREGHSYRYKAKEPQVGITSIVYRQLIERVLTDAPQIIEISCRLCCGHVVSECAQTIFKADFAARRLPPVIELYTIILDRARLV